jgi:hypothetical protein
VAANALVIGTDVVVTPTAMTIFIVATVPFEMIPEFEPETIQV